VPYRIDYTDEARRNLRRLPGYYRPPARRMIERLQADPRPPRAKELRDAPGRYRLRLDEWRIIYRVNDDLQEIVILAIRRKTGPETYEDIENIA